MLLGTFVSIVFVDDVCTVYLIAQDSSRWMQRQEGFVEQYIVFGLFLEDGCYKSILGTLNEVERCL